MILIFHVLDVVFSSNRFCIFSHVVSRVYPSTCWTSCRQSHNRTRGIYFFCSPTVSINVYGTVEVWHQELREGFRDVFLLLSTFAYCNFVNAATSRTIKYQHTNHANHNGLGLALNDSGCSKNDASGYDNSYRRRKSY